MAPVHSASRIPQSEVPRKRRAFTLLEAVIASSLTALAGSALLLGISTSLETTDDILNEVVAHGIAEQLMDDVVGKRYSAAGAGAYQHPLSANAYELAGQGRSRYDDIDDFVSYASQPPKDAFGITRGTEDDRGAARLPAFQIAANHFSRWRETIEVYYVSNTNLAQRLTGGNTSNYRAIEIHVYYEHPQLGTQELASLRRVVSYVPTPP